MGYSPKSIQISVSSAVFTLYLLPGPQPCGRAEQRSGRRIRASDCLSAVQRSKFELDPACR